MITFAELFDRLPFTVPLTIVTLAAAYLIDRDHVVLGVALIAFAVVELSLSRVVQFLSTYSIRRAKKNATKTAA